MTTLRDEATRLLSKMKESTRINGSVTCWLIPDNVLNDFRAALASSTPGPGACPEVYSGFMDGSSERCTLTVHEDRHVGKDGTVYVGHNSPHAAWWTRHPPASAPVPSSGTPRSDIESAVQAMHLAVGGAMKFESFRRNPKRTEEEIRAEADRSLKLEADAERAIRALAGPVSSQPVPSSGTRPSLDDPEVKRLVIAAGEVSDRADLMEVPGDTGYHVPPAAIRELRSALDAMAAPVSSETRTAPSAEAQNVEARFLLDAVSRALDGQDPGDFASSFPVVGEAMGLASRCASAECARDDHRASLVQYEKDWHRLLLLIAEVTGEEDPAAAVADEFDPWEALRKLAPRSQGDPDHERKP